MTTKLKVGDRVKYKKGWHQQVSHSIYLKAGDCGIITYIKSGAGGIVVNWDKHGKTRVSEVGAHPSDCLEKLPCAQVISKKLTRLETLILGD